jgi:hypothetical protein
MFARRFILTILLLFFIGHGVTPAYIQWVKCTLYPGSQPTSHHQPDTEAHHHGVNQDDQLHSGIDDLQKQ